jgi:hypothetical protein
MSQDVQDQLRVALLEYFRAIEQQQHPDAVQRPPLREHFVRIDSLSLQLPSDCDPQLRHYMTQKSYEKALNFLQDKADLNIDGNCGRKAK